MYKYFGATSVESNNCQEWWIRYFKWACIVHQMIVQIPIWDLSEKGKCRNDLCMYILKRFYKSLSIRSK